MALRSVARIVPSVRTVEGGGFPVRRPFPTESLSDVDPFLLLDEMGPSDVRPGAAKGAPDHPHRGFETVTYLLSGEMEHRDSAGHAGSLAAGDVQWMTAGAGVVHSEMPSAELQRSGGRLHGFQLWVNLPRREKMAAPRYQDLRAAAIPVVRTPDGSVTVRVLAGEALGATGLAETRVPVLLLHLALGPGASFELPVPSSRNALAWPFRGGGIFGRERRMASEGELVVFAPGGDAVGLSAPAGSALEALLLAGEPIGEPVVRYGPFVMSTEAEIVEAIRDWQAGRLGRI